MADIIKVDKVLSVITMVEVVSVHKEDVTTSNDDHGHRWRHQNHVRQYNGTEAHTEHKAQSTHNATLCANPMNEHTNRMHAAPKDETFNAIEHMLISHLITSPTLISCYIHVDVHANVHAAR